MTLVRVSVNAWNLAYAPSSDAVMSGECDDALAPDLHWMAMEAERRDRVFPFGVILVRAGFQEGFPFGGECWELRGITAPKNLTVRMLDATYLGVLLEVDGRPIQPGAIEHSYAGTKITNLGEYSGRGPAFFGANAPVVPVGIPIEQWDVAVRKDTDGMFMRANGRLTRKVNLPDVTPKPIGALKPTVQPRSQ